VIRLSCGEHSFLTLTHGLALDVIAGLGFDGVNVILWGDRSHVGVDEVRRDVAGCAARVSERIGSRGLEVADVVGIPSATDFGHLAINNPEPAEREASRAFFRDMLELAARLGGGLTILPGLDWEGETHEEALGRAADELVGRLGAAEQLGVPLSIEPHVGSICRSPADVTWLCENVPGLALTLDYTHYVMDGFSEASIEPLLPLTRHLHARGGASGRLQTSLADSTIDYERIVRLLAEQGYGGYIAVEYLSLADAGMTGIDVLTETVLMRDLLRSYLAAAG
jgi:sugar phosphate isomerase/epimerase